MQPNSPVPNQFNAPPQQEVPAPTSAPVLTPTPTPAPPQRTASPKKKIIIIFSIVLASLALIGLVAFILIQLTRANEVSEGYAQKTVDHLIAIGKKTDDEKKRVTLFRERVELPDVAFGTILSPQYREAEAVEKQYNELLDDSTQFFEEFYTLSALPSINTDLTDIVLTTYPASMGQVARADGIMDRADKLEALAAELEYCYFSDEYKSIQTTAVENLRKMSQASKDASEAIRTSGDSASTLSIFQSEYSEAYEKVKKALQESPQYGDEIAAYITDNDERMNAKFETYIKDFGNEDSL